MAVEILTKEDIVPLQEEIKKLREIIEGKLDAKAKVVPIEPLLVKKDVALAMLGGVSEHVLRELIKEGRLKPVRILRSTGEKLYSVAQINKVVNDLI